MNPQYLLAMPAESQRLSRTNGRPEVLSHHPFTENLRTPLPSRVRQLDLTRLIRREQAP